MSCRAIRFLPNQHAARWCGFEDSVGRVDRVTQDGIVAVFLRAMHGRQHLAGIDADMQLKRIGGIVGERAIAQCDGGAHRARGVVLVGQRRAKDREHCIAHHVDDRSAETPDLLSDALDTADNQCLYVLGIHSL